MVAKEFKRQMAGKGVIVNVSHIREARANELPLADLYVFSSPGRMGKPIAGMRRFLKKVELPAGARYAILTTELAPQPDKKTGKVPTEVGIVKMAACQTAHERAAERQKAWSRSPKIRSWLPD
jgi:hypothetical protein